MAGGGKGANRGGGGIPGWFRPFSSGRGDLLLAGRGRRGDSQAYLGPRALCRARDMMIDWAVLPPAGGMRPLSLIQAVRLALRGRTGSG
jgi:hypothetical protein